MDHAAALSRGDELNAQFLDLVCGDEELLCAEFDAIIAAGWGCAHLYPLRASSPQSAAVPTYPGCANPPVPPVQCGMRSLPRAPRGAPPHAGAPRWMRRPPRALLR